ncbi:MAG: ERF family protein [Rubrobacteraceae bacterium]|nr:ERF family protein [Rubrobacteraceae bacterium]
MSLTPKLLTAQQSVSAVVKRGKNTGTGSGYNYATAADVIEVSRNALHEAGLVGFIEDTAMLAREPITSNKGTAGMYAQVMVTLRIMEAEGLSPGDEFIRAAELRFTASGAGTDYPGDKAVYKAQTGATKYAYANALALPFADHDPEKDVLGEAGRLPKQQADPATALPDERVAEIAKSYKASGFTFERLSLAIGAVGGDSPKMNRKDSIRKAVASLTPEQADKLHNVLDAAEKSA